MKQCRHCHAEVPDQSQFCPECGQRQTSDSDHTAESVCPVCQEPIVAGSRFCGNCGHAFPAEGPSEETVPVSADEPSAESVQEPKASFVPVPPIDVAKTTEEDESDENFTESGDEPPETDKAAESQKEETETEAFLSPLSASSVEPSESAAGSQSIASAEADETTVEEAPAEEAPAEEEAVEEDSGEQPLAEDDSGEQPPVEETPVLAAAASATGPAFCPGCGYKLSANALFCPSCGRKTRRDTNGSTAAATPAIPLPITPQARPASGGWTPPAAAQQSQQRLPHAPPQNGGWAPPPSQGPAGGPPPRKKKKGLLIALIILLVFILGAGSAYLVFGREIRRMILGNKATYLKIEALQMKEDASEMARQLTDLASRKDGPAKGGHDFNLSLDWPDNMEIMDPVMQATLENLDIQGRLLYDRESAVPQYFAGIDLLTGTQPLLTIEGYYDQDQLIVGLPGILSRYLWIQRDTMDEYAGEMGIDPEDTSQALSLMDSLLGFDLGVSEVELAESLYAYIDIMLEHIDSVTYEKGQSLEVGSVSQEYERFTMTIGDENALKMIEQILLTLREDEVMFRLASEAGRMSAGLDPYGLEYDEFGEVMVPEMTLAEWQQAIDSLLAEIQAEDPDREPFTIVQSIYVDQSDQVYGRDFQILDVDENVVLQIEHYKPEKDDDGAVLLRMESEGEGITYENLYTWDDNRETRSGTITLSDNNTTLMDVSYTGYEKAEIGSRVYILGDFELAADNEAEPIVLSYRASREGDRVNMVIGIQDMMSMRIGYQEISAADVTFPSFSSDQLVSITDFEALAGLLDENAMSELMRVAQQLGLIPQGDVE